MLFFATFFLVLNLIVGQPPVQTPTTTPNPGDSTTRSLPPIVTTSTTIFNNRTTIEWTTDSTTTSSITTEEPTTTSTTDPTTTSIPPTDTTDEPSENICDNNFGQRIPDPEACNQFFHCVLSVPYLYICPPNTIFSADEERCVSGDSETCIFFSIEEICNGVFFRALPHPNSNRLFVGCVQGEPAEMQCFEGEVFNEFTSKCEQA